MQKFIGKLKEKKKIIIIVGIVLVLVVALIIIVPKLFFKKHEISTDNPTVYEFENYLKDSIKPFTEETVKDFIEKEKLESAITGSILVNNGKVSLQTKRVVKLLTSDDYGYFMTYNPYTEEMLNKFTDIHNETDFSIAVGVFGHLDDKTYEEKMEMFSRFKRTLNRDYQVYECNTDDIYVAGVASIKKLNRRRK